MSDHEEEKSEFKVVDKRRFTESGEKKDDAPEPPKPKAAPQDEQPTSSNASASPPEVDFSSFVVSLATQALALLGEIPHPETQEVVVNLEASKQLIDILGMLEEKTKGNLSAEEKLLGDIVASVRMAFVGKTKG